jgi:hypothetical protein
MKALAQKILKNSCFATFGCYVQFSGTSELLKVPPFGCGKRAKWAGLDSDGFTGKDEIFFIFENPATPSRRTDSIAYNPW